MGNPPRPLAELAGNRSFRNRFDRERYGLAPAKAPLRGSIRFLPSPCEELGAALVIHVEQRSDDNRKDHQNDVDLHAERGQKIVQRSKWVVGEHHYLDVSLLRSSASTSAAFGGFNMPDVASRSLRGK
jgi:hypothetical protein